MPRIVNLTAQADIQEKYLTQLNAAIHSGKPLLPTNLAYSRKAAQKLALVPTTPMIDTFADDILFEKFLSLDIVEQNLVTVIRGVLSNVHMPQISSNVPVVSYACDLEPSGDIKINAKELRVCHQMISFNLCPEELVSSFVQRWYVNADVLPENVGLLVIETLTGIVNQQIEANYFAGNPDQTGSGCSNSLTCYGWLKQWWTDGVYGGANVSTPVGTAPVTAANTLTVLNTLISNADPRLLQLMNLGFQQNPTINPSYQTSLNSRVAFVCSPATQAELLEGIRQSATSPLSEVGILALPNAYKGIPIYAFGGMPDNVVIFTYYNDRQGHSNFLMPVETDSITSPFLVERISGQHNFRVAANWRQGAQVKETFMAEVWGDLTVALCEPV